MAGRVGQREGRSGLKEKERASEGKRGGQGGARAFDPWCVGEVSYGVRNGPLTSSEVAPMYRRLESIDACGTRAFPPQEKSLVCDATRLRLQVTEEHARFSRESESRTAVRFGVSPERTDRCVGILRRVVSTSVVYRRFTVYDLRFWFYGSRLTAYGLRLMAYGFQLTTYGFTN